MSPTAEKTETSFRFSNYQDGEIGWGSPTRIKKRAKAWDSSFILVRTPMPVHIQPRLSLGQRFRSRRDIQAKQHTSRVSGRKDAPPGPVSLLFVPLGEVTLT